MQDIEQSDADAANTVKAVINTIDICECVRQPVSDAGITERGLDGTSSRALRNFGDHLIVANRTRRLQCSAYRPPYRMLADHERG